MIEKLMFISFFFSLCVGSTMAYDIYFEYEDKDYGTSFKTNVEESATFVFNGKVDPERSLTSFFCLKYPNQIKLKNYALGVGIDEYKNGNQSLKTCANDARNIANPYNSYFSNSYILTNNFATKDAVRQKIADISDELGEGDNFLFFYSGYSNNNSALCFYDSDYTSSEFLGDFEKFKEGVNIIIMLDSVSVSTFLDALPNDFVNRPNVLIFAGSKTPTKKYSKSLSPFTFAWYKTKDYLTDENKDQFLTFFEIACRIKLYLAKNKIKESFFFSNETLAKKVIYHNTMLAEDYGEISFNEDGSQFNIVASDIDNYALIHIETQKRFVHDIAIYPKKGSLNVNLKKDSHPTKFSLEFDTYYLPEDNLSLTMNNVLIPTFKQPKVNKNGKSGTYTIEDYNYKKVGTLKFKKENEVYHCKLNVNGMNELANVLEAASGVESIDLLVRFTEQMHNSKISFDKKYTPGKSLSAKLVN